MNVYDFDGTIYDGDSSVDFYLFCIRRRPYVFFRCLPAQLGGALLFCCKRISKEGFKERFFIFLRFSDVDEAFLEAFWEKNASRIKKWYLKQKKESDIIISASPDFLLRPICRKMGVSLIATSVDSFTGRINGRNCRGNEKLKRFYAEYPNAEIDEFYTDSKADVPLARKAKKAYWVRKDKVTRYPGCTIEEVGG